MTQKDYLEKMKKANTAAEVDKIYWAYQEDEQIAIDYHLDRKITEFYNAWMNLADD